MKWFENSFQDLAQTDKVTDRHVQMGLSIAA